MKCASRWPSTARCTTSRGGTPWRTAATPPIEGQIANLADRLAYDCHDLEDALGAGLITEEQLATVALWAEAAAMPRSEYPNSPLAAIRRPILGQSGSRDARGLIVAYSRRQIAAAGIKTIDDVRACGQPHG